MRETFEKLRDGYVIETNKKNNKPNTQNAYYMHFYHGDFVDEFNNIGMSELSLL